MALLVRFFATLIAFAPISGAIASPIPDEFRTDRPPLTRTTVALPAMSQPTQSAGSSLERGQAAATLNSNYYNVIAPTFNGSDGNTSFIRLGNSGTAATTFTVTVVGSPSGVVYGAGTLQVPAAASPQYSLAQILTAASAGALTGGDTSYAIYMQDPDSYLSYQHVIYNGGNQFFENVSACHSDPANNDAMLNSLLYNVHTSQLAAYPAQIYIHNFSTSSGTYDVSVYDTNTGTLIGTVPLTLPANSTYTVPFSYFQQQLKWTPASNQLHANMVFAPEVPATFQIEVADYIYNQQLAAYVNMTQRCGFVSSSPTAKTYEGTIAGDDGVTNGTIEITVQDATASANLLITGASTVVMSGTYTAATGALSLAGGGYTFTGTASGTTLSGSYTGPAATTATAPASPDEKALSGNGGRYAALSGRGLTKMCGTYTGGSTGVFSIQFGPDGSGFGITSGAIATTLTGQIKADKTFTGTTASGQAITGSIAHKAMSGTFARGNGGTGTFSGTPCGNNPISDSPVPGITRYNFTLNETLPGNLSLVPTPSASVTVNIACSQCVGGVTTYSVSAPSGGGSVAYPVGTTITLTASVGGGATFAGWAGSCSGTALTCTVTINTTTTVTANFNPR